MSIKLKVAKGIYGAVLLGLSGLLLYLVQSFTWKEDLGFIGLLAITGAAFWAADVLRHNP